MVELIVIVWNELLTEAEDIVNNLADHRIKYNTAHVIITERNNQRISFLCMCYVCK